MELKATQSMAKLATLLELHLDRLPPTVVIQATTWWETVITHAELQECGLVVHLPVKVRCYCMEIEYYNVDIARSVVLRCSETGKKSLFFTCATCVPRHYTNCTQSNLEKRKIPSYFCICVEACAGAAQEHAKPQQDDCTGQTHCWWHRICVCFLDYWCM